MRRRHKFHRGNQAIPLKPYHHAEFAVSLQEAIVKVSRNVLFGWANDGGWWDDIHAKQDGALTVRLRGGQTVSFALPEGPATVVLDSHTGERLRRCAKGLGARKRRIE